MQQLIQLEQRAALLRRRGKSMQEIADELGLTRLEVFRMLQRN